jgi:hypothetical protein
MLITYNSAQTAVIADVAYGIDIREGGEQYAVKAEEAMESLTEAGIPGGFLVDLLPFCDYLYHSDGISGLIHSS